VDVLVESVVAGAAPLSRWRPRAVAFDLDGTLLNTERYCGAAKAAVLWAHGVVPDMGFVEAMKGLHYSVVGERLAEMLPEHDPASVEELVEEFTGAFGGMVAANPRVMPGAGALVEFAAASVPLAVASNTRPATVRTGLEGAGLLRHFAHVVTPGPGQRPKPAPDIYRQTAALCGVPVADLLAVEDSRSGLLAAVASGARVLGVGPDPSPATRELAEWWVPSLADPGLLAWVREWGEARS